MVMFTHKRLVPAYYFILQLKGEPNPNVFGVELASANIVFFRIQLNYIIAYIFL